MNHKHQPGALQVGMLDAALDYAKLGWSVFPARITGKQKLSWRSAENSNGNNWGYTNDPDQIRDYWRRWPNAAIGLPTGAVNGLFVIDIDTIEGHGVDGRKSLVQLQVQHGNLPWPHTRQAISPTGSTHYYFKQPSGLIIPSTASKLGPGIDVRGDGGFVVAPPSVRPGRGAYKWITYCGIASAPKWLLDLVAVRPRTQAVTLDQVQERVALDPEIAAMLRADAGKGTSTSPEDYFPDDVDLKLKIRVALAHIPSEAYTDELWYKLGAAIHDGLGDDGFDVFDEWSQMSPDYKKTDCIRKWRHVSRKVRSFKVATIFYHADMYDREWRKVYQQMLGDEVA